jgi:hypothetical protein
MARVTGASFVGVTNNERINAIARAKAARLGLDGRAGVFSVGMWVAVKSC